MTVIGTDAYGPYTDTGVATAPTPRPSTEVETHLASEVDSGSKNAPSTLAASHTPHRSATSPR